MLVYIYSLTTGEFVQEYVCHPSPLEPGQYIIPTESTTLPPPIVEGKVAVFENTDWVLVTDHRGEIWFDKDTGEEVEVDTLVISDNLVSEIPQHIVEAKLWAELTATAAVELSKSDITLLRCYENSISAPVEWTQYRKELRDVVSGRSRVLPTKPTYPVGS